MALTIGDNFSYQGSKPLDARLTYNTIAEMASKDESTLYDGIMAFCKADEKNYQWKSTNEVDETLGKWREFEACGHTILDNADTEYASRTNLKFGGDIAVTDDPSNDATKVTPHRLTSAELKEIVSPIPSGQRTMPVLFDETGAEYVVGWYKRASDGKKKPVYEKTITGTLPTTTNEIQTFAVHGITDIDNVHIVASSAQATDGTWYNIGTTSTLNIWDAWVNTTNIRNKTQTASLASQTGNITIQYTKTSDSWQ